MHGECEFKHGDLSPLVGTCISIWGTLCVPTTRIYVRSNMGINCVPSCQCMFQHGISSNIGSIFPSLITYIECFCGTYVIVNNTLGMFIFTWKCAFPNENTKCLNYTHVPMKGGICVFTSGNICFYVGGTLCVHTWECMFPHGRNEHSKTHE
jgi:hypothetical protein